MLGVFKVWNKAIFLHIILKNEAWGDKYNAQQILKYIQYFNLH